MTNDPRSDDAQHSSVDTQASRPDPAQGPAHDLPVFTDLVDGVRTCMFTTVDQDGTILSRPMAVQQVEDGGTVWFFAYADSPKLEQLAIRPAVNLAFVDGDTFVSVSGTARLVDDVAKRRELWNAFAKAWFQSEADDPGVALIRVDPSGGEYWDAPNKPAQVVGLVKGLLGQGVPMDGDNAKLDLD